MGAASSGQLPCESYRKCLELPRLLGAAGSTSGGRHQRVTALTCANVRGSSSRSPLLSYLSQIRLPETDIPLVSGAGEQGLRE